MSLEKRTEKRTKNEKIKEILSWVICIAAAVGLAFVLRTFVFELIRVDGESMVPTLQENQHVMIEKVSRYWDGIERGEIVVTRYPNRKECFIKRLVAKEGDTVAVRDGYLYVNGQRLEEPYINARMIYELEQLTVPAGYVYVLGDNRNLSIDSHTIGPIKADMLMGRMLLSF